MHEFKSILYNPRPSHAALLLRLALAAIFLSHGITRAALDRVTPFGEFLDASGFPFGLALAWGVTVFEMVGGVALLANRFVLPVCALLIVEMLLGIVLVHVPNGWFVVGHGTNGVEYSVLIVASLLAVIALHRSE